ncbi:unnamed protein product [Gongylonema pulchrum]|uniref:Uncharacterized protein n=1 Tax=Gongylonema pulchrum TaxID=637853 RepID=A0A183CY78_9BILA|nr:unnamed protein product [Gongylonema pulchrum]
MVPSEQGSNWLRRPSGGAANNELHDERNAAKSKLSITQEELENLSSPIGNIVQSESRKTEMNIWRQRRSLLQPPASRIKIDNEYLYRVEEKAFMLPLLRVAAIVRRSIVETISRGSIFGSVRDICPF